MVFLSFSFVVSWGRCGIFIVSIPDLCHLSFFVDTDEITVCNVIEIKTNQTVRAFLYYDVSQHVCA